MKAVFQVLSFDVLSKLVLGVLGIALIRYMPPAEYAEYTFALSLAAFVTQSISVTFNRVYILSAPQDGGQGNEWSAIGLQAFLIVALVVLGLPLISSLGNSYWLITALILANCASDFAKTYYQRDLKFFRFSLIELSRSMLFFVGAVVLIALSEASVSSNAIISVQAVSLLVVAWWALSRRLSEWNATNIREIAAYARGLIQGKYTHLFAYFFIVGIFAQTDIFMLKIVGDETMLATYGSAFRYYSILSLALGAVHVVLLPMIQKLSSNQELRMLLAAHRRVLLLFVLVAAVAGWLAEWVIPWVDSGKYPEAITTFRILCISAVISLAFSPHANLLMRYERFRFLSFVIITALAVHIGLCLLLIPLHGASGTAVATTIAAALANVVFFFKSREQVRQHLAA